MIEKVDMVIHQALPPKREDPSKFTISCNIGGVKIPHALCDLRSSINFITLKKVKELKVGEIRPSNMTLTFADSSVTQPLGILRDVLVHIDGVYPSGFVVLDTKGYSGAVVIPGRPFLATGKAKIVVETGELVLKFNKEKMVFKVYDWTQYMEDLDTCYHMEEKGSKVDKGKGRSELTGVRVSLALDVF